MRRSILIVAPFFVALTLLGCDKNAGKIKEVNEWIENSYNSKLNGSYDIYNNSAEDGHYIIKIYPQYCKIVIRFLFYPSKSNTNTGMQPINVEYQFNAGDIDTKTVKFEPTPSADAEGFCSTASDTIPCDASTVEFHTHNEKPLIHVYPIDNDFNRSHEFIAKSEYKIATMDKSQGHRLVSAISNLAELCGAKPSAF